MTLAAPALLLGTALVFPAPAAARVPLGEARVQAPLAGLRLPFIANQGQIDPQVAYYAPTFAGTLFVTQQGELVYALRGRPSAVPGAKPCSAGPGWTLIETLESGQARPVGRARSATGVSYLLGSDAARRRLVLPTYEQISLGEVWPGVMVALHANAHSVEKVFTVRPGASVDNIRIRFGGTTQALTIAPGGALVATTGLGAVTFTPPIAYQERGGVRVSVPVAYRTTGAGYGFVVKAYDPGLPLVIDPVLQSTYLGGNGGDDTVWALAISPQTGDVYVAGDTSSTNFPGTDGGAQTTPGDSGAFVARLNRTLTSLVQATYLRGNSFGSAQALAISPATGDVYVAGSTSAADFPGTAGGAQATYGGRGDGFVARLSSDLTAVVRATYLGGSGSDAAWALAISPTTGDVYVAGGTDSKNFPGTAGGAQPASGGGSSDAFVVRLNSGLTSILQATYLGGDGGAAGFALAIAPVTGNVYVAGRTRRDFSGPLSPNFPGTAGGAQPVYGGGDDGFVARLNGNLTSLTQATYLGGADDDTILALAIAPTTGDVYVVGGTLSINFPGTAGGAQPVFSGGFFDAFVARLSPGLTSIGQATYLGGTGADFGRAIAIEGTTGDVYVAGQTTSVNFPGTTGGVQPPHGGGADIEAFVARLPGSLTSITQATYLGGSRGDTAFALAIAPTTREIYVAGQTISSDFPGTIGGARWALSGGLFVALPGADGFVARLTPGLERGVQLSGRVTDATGAGVRGILIDLAGAARARTVTDDTGRFQLFVSANNAYTVTPASPGLATAPATRSVTVGTQAIGNVDFTATVTDGVALFVVGLYQDVLARSPGPSELPPWVAYVRQNCNQAGLGAAAASFLDSEEFRTARPLTLPDLVDVLYGAVLARGADPAGLAGWVGVLRQGRLAIDQGFVFGPEFRNRVPNRAQAAAVEAVIGDFYIWLLGRGGSQDERQSWVDYVVASGDLEGAAIAFLASAEFEQRALIFHDDVAILYRALLGRFGGATELDGWEGVLRTQLLRVLDGFLSSPEFLGRIPKICSQSAP